MIRKTIHSFDDINETGLDEIPLNQPILIEDVGETGYSRIIILTSKDNITDTTTIGDLMGTLTTNWVTLAQTNSNAITIGTTPPLESDNGDFWWNSEDGKLKIYYYDGDTSQWIDAFVSRDGTNGTDGVDGVDGLGFTGGSYDSNTGIVTFTSDDGLGFSTDDLRGTGIPSGGVTGQVLSKASSTNYDLLWITPVKTDSINVFTLPQRSGIYTSNSGTFDLNLKNTFKCTPTANITLTFSNIPETFSQSGVIFLYNTGGYSISKGPSVKSDSNFLNTVSSIGTYVIGYETDGTNVYVTTTSALS